MLASIKANQPGGTELPDIDAFRKDAAGSVEKYIEVLEWIGGKVYRVKNYDEIIGIIQENFADAKRIVSTVPEINIFPQVNLDEDPHLLENIDLAIIRPHFAVAENSAVWVTDDILRERVLPFICQYIAVILQEKDIVPTMHHAYERIGSAEYGFGTFIAGPSKTADIEQSLVLGAHGPKGLTAFILND
jgi:L-lactate dehydrogenase complex protein LldG